jgi:TctA family transporter
MMVGMFAVSEILRYRWSTLNPGARPGKTAACSPAWTPCSALSRCGPPARERARHRGRHPAGASADAWRLDVVCDEQAAVPQRGRRVRHRAHRGLIEAGAANNSALAGAWIPALVFGIPGDSITAIAIGVLYLKGLNPGPSIFINNAPSVYAIFMVFVLANIIMLPLGWACIKAANKVLSVPRTLLMPVVLLFCIVGAYAVNNSLFSVGVVLFFGVVAFVLEENGFPVAPAILGVVLGTMLEENFITSMIKSDGSPAVFFTRPIAGGLAIATFVILLWPVGAWAVRRLRGKAQPA